MTLTVYNLDEGYVHAVRLLMRHGYDVASRAGRTRELTGVHLVCEDPSRNMLPVHTNRAVPTRLAAVEAASLVAGEYHHDLICRAAPRYAAQLVDPDPQASAAVAYGPRTRLGLAFVLTQLARDPDTRQAVLAIWWSSDLVRRADKPCTLSLQFLIRRGRLQLHSTMRSQDVWLGLALDGFMFTQLQQTVARELGIEVGTWHHSVASFHAYERDWERLADLHYDPAIEADELPHGIVGGVAAAEALLRPLGEDVSPLGVAEANPWYARKLALLQATAP